MTEFVALMDITRLIEQDVGVTDDDPREMQKVRLELSRSDNIFDRQISGLMTRKESLTKQLKTINDQIAALRKKKALFSQGSSL